MLLVHIEGIEILVVPRGLTLVKKENECLCEICVDFAETWTNGSRTKASIVEVSRKWEPELYIGWAKGR